MAAAVICVALALAGSAIADGSSGSTGTTGTTGQTGPTTPPPPAPTRFRAIGCKLKGPEVAYFRGNPKRKLVALAFDDGPSLYTAAFVAMLHSLHVRATFFMIGEQITPAYAQTLRLELRYGDALGDHTWTHPVLTGVSDVSSELGRTISVIHSVTGYSPCVFRPPYGAYNQSVIDTARSLGLATVMWDVDPSDWKLPGVGSIEDRVLDEVQPGSIVISHDGGGNRAETLAAYPTIIASLRARGYRFVTVPQLLGFHTIYVPCRRHCRREAVHLPLPRGSIVQGD